MICAKSIVGKSQCCFAVCCDCYNTIPLDSEKRGRKQVKASVQCSHDLQDLKINSNLWWCEPVRKDGKGLFSWTWLQRVKGCVGCNKMFVQVATQKEKKQLLQTLPPIAPVIHTLWDRLDAGLISSDNLEEVLKEAELDKADGPKDILME